MAGTGQIANPPPPTDQGSQQQTSSLAQPYYQPTPTQGQAYTYAGTNQVQPAVVGSGGTSTPYAPTPYNITSQADPSVTAAQSNAQTSLDPNLVNSLGSAQTIQQLLQGFAPVQQQATMNLNDQLASLGISGGAGIQAQNGLQSQLSAAIAPTIASAIQNSQSNTLNAGEFGSSQGLQQALANAGYQQSANSQTSAQNLAQSQFNAGQGLNQNQFTSAQNLAGNEFNANQIANASLQNAQLGQQAGLTNTASQNSILSQNLGNLYGADTNNTNNANAAQQNLLNQILQGYYQNSANFNALNQQGLGASDSLAGQGLSGIQSLAGGYANNFPIQNGAAQAGAGLGAALGGLSGGGGSNPLTMGTLPAGQL